MTEKTLKHELYKHGSYLISLKESGSSFVNIDEEIKKLEELFQLASKKDTPPFAVGGHYSDGKVIYKVLEIEEYPDTKEVRLAVLALYSGDLYEDTYEIDFPCDDKPATAEQIKMFKVAEAIERSGLTPEQHKQMISDGKINIGVWSALQTTAEELQEVEHGENI